MTMHGKKPDGPKRKQTEEQRWNIQGSTRPWAEIDMMRDAVRRFNRRNSPPCRAIDRDNLFPPTSGARSATSACSASPRQGRRRQPTRLPRHIVAMEEISRASRPRSAFPTAHSNLCVNQIRRNGNDAQAAKYPQADLRRTRRRAGDVRTECSAPTSSR